MEFRRCASDGKIRAAVLAMTAVMALGGGTVLAGGSFAAVQGGIRNLDVIQDIGVGLRDDQGDEIAPPADPTATAEPTDTPEPAATAEPTDAPEPAATPEPRDTPEPAATAEPTDNQNGDQGNQAEPTDAPEQDGDQAEPTHAPRATETPEQTQAPDGGDSGGSGGDSNGGSEGG